MRERQIRYTGRRNVLAGHLDPMLQPHHRLAILLHGGIRGQQGKTGLTVLRYSANPIAVVIDRDAVGDSVIQQTGIPREAPIVGDIAAALAHQPDVLVIGIAPSGGLVPDEWWPELRAAIAAGLSIVNGLHTRLDSHPQLPSLQPGQWVWDVRQPPSNTRIGSGAARELPCQRLLLVGTDMAIGKMSAGLEIQAACAQRGIKSAFVATGQAGIMISGQGVALDAIKVDHAAGAIEQATIDHSPGQDLLIIEGQGSILHPGSTATLPLLRGSQPTQLVLVHKAGQTTIRNCPQVTIPPLPRVIKLYEQLAEAAGAFAPVPVVAVAINGRDLDDGALVEYCARVAQETGLPCADVVRFGAEPLLDSLMLGVN
jgi:uncharacterized NAD-dependent epimerase/dehydratase family protein